MTRKRSIEDEIGAWFTAEAPSKAPDQILRSTASRLAVTQQRRRWRPLMPAIGTWSPRLVGVGLTAALLIVLTAVGLPARLPGIGALPTASQGAPTASASGVPSSPSAGSTLSPDPNRAMDIRFPEGFDYSQAYLLDGTYGVTFEVANRTLDTQCNVVVAAQGPGALPQVILWTTLAPGSTLYSATGSATGRTETFPRGLYRFTVGTEDAIVAAASAAPSLPPSASMLCESWSLELMAR
ncbi:MAG: hypothetical protein ABI573_11595 [Chloroflexota bacterium]